MTAIESTNPLDLAYEAGSILLENGAEISRVEETMRRIASHYGVEVNRNECLKINAAAKRFNTTGVKRMLTNVWLSLIPVRAWRLKFCWWSTVPKIKEVGG